MLARGLACARPLVCSLETKSFSLKANPVVYPVSAQGSSPGRLCASSLSSAVLA